MALNKIGKFFKKFFNKKNNEHIGIPKTAPVQSMELEQKKKRSSVSNKRSSESSKVKELRRLAQKCKKIEVERLYIARYEGISHLPLIEFGNFRKIGGK